MKRLAKLKTEVTSDEFSLRVLAFDDESEMPEEPVMWLDATLEYENEHPSYYESEEEIEYYNEQEHDKGKLKSIYVSVIDFDNKLYFAMPEARQRACGSTLIKKFIRYYTQHYGKNTDNWVPVHASFANYDLQEQFKNAVDAGIFPPQSKDMIMETTEENYRKQRTYNLDNRRLLNEMKENPQKFFGNFEIVGGFMINPKFSQIEELITSVRDKYGFEFKNFEGMIEDGDLTVMLPTAGHDLPYDATNFYFDPDSKVVVFSNAESPDNIKRIIQGKESVMASLFDSVTEICFGWLGGDPITPQEFFSSQEKTASNIRRLLRNIKRG
ncbi:MAG: hypothetical protein K0R18_67 [Bacillales bacterium]|jgi:hypothetical protein|nr:hypothetical protein [Bacillales bacterium]